MDQHNRTQVVVPTPPPPALQDAASNSISFGRALQYTPLATSMLPVHDRIPVPQICRPRESTRLATTSERKKMQQSLINLPVNKVKERLNSLLKGENLSEIKFRNSPAPNVHGRQTQQYKAPEQTLNPIARMVLDVATIDYRYSSRSKSVTSNQPISDRPSARQSPAVARAESSYLDNVWHTHQVPTPAKSPISIKRDGPKPVVIDVTAASVIMENQKDRDDTMIDKTRLEVTQQPAPLAVHVKSQRDASDAALLNFQNGLMEIFEAQDQLDAGSTNVYDTGFFDDGREGEESEPNLSIKTLERLQVSLKKLVTLKRWSDLSAEHLRRLQRLCEPPVDRAQTVNLRLPTNSSPDDEDEWIEKIRDAEIGIASAAVCLYTMLGCPNEESLLFTDARSWIPNVLANAFESCLIPIIEARPDGQDSGLFNTAANNKDHLKRLLENGKKLLDTMSTVCAEVKGSDNSVNPIEFLCVKLIFVQNATIDKQSCLGIQAFEKVRKTAMSCLARLYARYPRERQTILDEVLSSLDKLPSNSRSARQYKLGNGKSIQLITALFMQLVQTTALELPELGAKAKRKTPLKGPDDSGESDDEGESNTNVHENGESDSKTGPLLRLRNKAVTLFDSSARSAHDIVVYLVSRASKTTKTGDSPYRNVLDLFVEDLVAVLPDPEWPSSELMLRILARRMIHLANHDKAAATKNMALESLGAMGSAVCTQKALIPSLSAALEREGRQQTDVSIQLCELARAQDAGTLKPEDMIGINGPFAIVSRQLWSDAGQNLRTRSACGYFLAHYAKLVSRMPDSNVLDDNDIEAQPIRIANWLLELIPHVGSETNNISNFDAVNSDEAELGYALCILNVGFCSFFGEIVKTLATSFSSDQALVRSRSLKSVVSMLETDSSLLDRDQTIAEDIFRCASDESALVRDSALSLIARFIISKPALQQKGIKRLLDCASDSKVGVQKRAITHLKDVYVGDTREFLRSKIAFTFLQRTGDHEETVADLARKTLSDVWITSSIAKLTNPSESSQKLAIEHLSLDIVRCIAHEPLEMASLLEKFLIHILKGESNGAGKVHELCSKIVDELFERTISGANDQEPLHTLAAFAAANSQLIKPDRLAKLQSYLGNIKSDNDLFMFRSVIGIYRSVLPDLSATHKPLLADIQVALMRAIPSLGRRAELDPLMSCLHTIDGVLKNTLKLVKFTASVFNGIRLSREIPQKLSRLLRMAGAIARYLDLEDYLKPFTMEVKDFHGKSIANYMASTFDSLTVAGLSFETRALALEALGSLCQASPIQFNEKEVRATLFAALSMTPIDSTITTEQSEQLQHFVLKTFDELYAHRSQAKAIMDKGDEDGEKQELGKLGGDGKTRDGDSAVVIVTREVVNHVLSIALSMQGDNAFLATRILASISHEGLIHPKQSTGAFVALGTCTDARVASVAHEAHRLLHQTHESVCEREYMNAVQQAFDYQSFVIADPTGAKADGYRAKLADCFDIINTSNAKYVKKFLSGLVTRIANDITAQDFQCYSNKQVLFARFVLQNVAFFDYRKVDDLLHTILQLELAYSKSGGEVVQMIEQNLPKEPHAASMQDGFVITDGAHIVLEEQVDHIQSLTQLAPVAATLTLLIETRSYLVRQYAVGRDVRAAINSNKHSKDSGKPPSKVYGINGERLWTKTNNLIQSLDEDSGMIICCQNFVGLMNVDEDLEIDAETYPHEADNDSHAQPNGNLRANTPGNRKRKGSASVGNTPSKRSRQVTHRESRRSGSVSSDTEADDDDYQV